MLFKNINMIWSNYIANQLLITSRVNIYLICGFIESLFCI